MQYMFVVHLFICSQYMSTLLSAMSIERDLIINNYNIATKIKLIKPAIKILQHILHMVIIPPVKTQHFQGFNYATLFSAYMLNILHNLCNKGYARTIRVIIRGMTHQSGNKNIVNRASRA